MEANTTVALETEVSVGDETFTYERSVETDENGAFEVVVAYPGDYSVGDDVSLSVNRT